MHVDKIDRSRDNRAYSQERGIRISGPPLGRPPANISKEKKKQAVEDERVRNAIEGKFGQGKRREASQASNGKASLNFSNSDWDYFFGHESFHPAAAGFVSFFMSISKENTFSSIFWLFEPENLSFI